MDKVNIKGSEYIIYFKSENENILCLGLEGNNTFLPFPVDKYGEKLRINNRKIVGEIVVFYNVERDRFYYIKVLEYISKKQPRFVVQYNNEPKKELQCRNFINNCQITNIVNDFQSLNTFYYKDDYWIMEVLNKKTGEIVEIMFDGNEETIQKIRNSSWFLYKNGKGENTYYIMTGSYNQTGKGISLHQVVFGNVNKGNVVNHKSRANGKWKDNRRCNLEEITKSKNSKNRAGAGFPKPKCNGWRFNITVNGYKITSPTKPTYEEADIDALIIQKYYNYEHRKDEWGKIENIDGNYVNQLIKIMEYKLEKAKENQRKSFGKNKYEIVSENCVRVFESKGRSCLIDLDDIDILQSSRVSIDKTGYWYLTTKDSSVRLHRFLLGIYETNVHAIQVDHLNRIKEDNRKSNLIITTSKGNLCNKSGKGYSFSKGSYKVHYSSFWDFLSQHKYIDSSKEPIFKTEIEAKEEVFKRKWLANYIRPQFKNYEEYLSFFKTLNEKEKQNIDKYYINSRFPNINEIKIPKYVEKE